MHEFKDVGLKKGSCRMTFGISMRKEKKGYQKRNIFKNKLIN